MKQLSAQKLSSGLLVLSVLLLICDVLLLPLLPVFAYFRSGDPNFFTIASLQRIFVYDFDDGLGNLLHIIFVEAIFSNFITPLSVTLYCPKMRLQAPMPENVPSAVNVLHPREGHSGPQAASKPTIN